MTEESTMTFDLDKSQQNQNMTTSDTKVELVAITMKPHKMWWCVLVSTYIADWY